MSTSFFVASHWLAEHIDDPEIQILDARMAPAGQEHLRNMAQEYRAGHLPGARFFDIEALSDHSTPLPHMMPRPEAFAVAMRELGVSHDKHLIVYDEGNLFSAPRAWWMLRAFGVQNVSILAGAATGSAARPYSRRAERAVDRSGGQRTAKNHRRTARNIRGPGRGSASPDYRQLRLRRDGGGLNARSRHP